jgi:hypothetical protein
MPFPAAKDVTGPLRSRRYRQKKNGKQNKPAVTVGTSVTRQDMSGLAGRLAAGHVTARGAELAARLLIGLVTLLPRDGSLMLPDSCPYVGLTAPEDTKTQPKIANSAASETLVNTAISQCHPTKPQRDERIDHTLKLRLPLRSPFAAPGTGGHLQPHCRSPDVVGEEIRDGGAYFGTMRLEREVPSFEEAHFGIRDVAFEGLRAWRQEERIVLAPDGQ